MKKQLPIYTLVVLMAAAIFLSAATYQQKDKNDKNGNGQDQGKGNQKAKENNGQAKANAGNSGNKGNQGNDRNANGNGNDKINGNGNGNVNGNARKDKKDNDKFLNEGPGNSDKGNRGRARIVNLTGNGSNWYNWNNDNFKDRKQFRNKEKVTICHKFNSSDEPVTISVSANAADAHRKHGDIIGGCPAVSNSIFSDIFRKRRATYYSDLYSGQDQYNYSSSILDYALMRLTNSRVQLDNMRANNASQADIDRSQGAVVELEENVSVLETLLGVAGQVLVNRL